MPSAAPGRSGQAAESGRLVRELSGAIDVADLRKARPLTRAYSTEELARPPGAAG